ncbi:hypothetical protein ACWG5P_11260 [Streptomyces prasinus]
MDVKKGLGDAAADFLVKGVAELIKVAKEFSFEKEADGGMRVAATFNTTRVVIEAGGPAGFNLNFGEVKGKARGKRTR